jgi:glycerophosphoryl diester phosphodiesterase
MISLARRGRRPLCIGHRGAPALAPENTLSSFRAAVAHGVDLVEFDVLELHSGELVVAHSDDFAEVSHGAAVGTVRDRSLPALRELAPDLPTLGDALAFFADDATSVGLHVDLKSPAAVDALVAAVQRFGLAERTLVSSFHRGALRRIAALEPQLRAGVSFPEDRLRISHRRGSAPFIRAGLLVTRPVSPLLASALLGSSRASTLVLHHALVSSRTVRFAHARGVPVVAWTVDEERDLVRVDEAGVDAVVVNNPGLFVSTLEP